MPATHQFNRRIAAFGAALALVALPISSTISPAFAQPSPAPTAEAGTDGNTGTEAAANDTEAGSDSNTASTNGAGDDSDDNGDGSDEGGDGGNDQQDPACANPDDGAEAGPCAVKDSVKAKWGGNSAKTLQLTTADTAADNKPGNMPRNWVGKTFKLKKKKSVVRIPVQESSESSSQSGDGAGETDDSGNPLPSATAQAAVPDELSFNDDGFVVPASGGDPVEFTGFTQDPRWEFNLNTNGQIVVSSGEGYSEPDDGSDSDDNDGTKDGAGGSSSNKDGSNDSNPTAATDGSKDGATASASADSDDSDSNNSSSADSNNSADSNATKNSGPSSNSSASSDSNSSTDSDARDRANSSTDRNADGTSSNSNADTGSRADGSRSSDSDTSGSDSTSGDDDEKDSDSDSDGSGSNLGASDADGTTPDPSNGNGSPDERETIPGTAGDEWLPGDEDSPEHPDYSDPVPRNPDEQTPKDDTDLITGGDAPSPRANKPPVTSFGESIVSTIVSSWPVFVLAASGMAAVGFIIYLMGRRGKQE